MDINYKNWITSIAARFKQAQIKAATQVNAEMLRFYWELGKDVLQLSETSAYGDKVLQKISKDLQSELPDVKSFSPTNLLYMKNFYTLYYQYIINAPQLVGQSENESAQIIPQVVEQSQKIQLENLFRIPWGHHRYVIDKCKGLDKVEAQYALESSSQPIGISGYTLSKLIPEKFKSSLPSIEEIEDSINN